MKGLSAFVIGIVLTIIGAFLFLSNVHVYSFGFFYRYGGTNITALLILALCILFVLYIIYPKTILGFALGVTFLLLIISIIMSMHFYVDYMSAFEILLILATFFGGIGLTLRSIIYANAEEKKNRKK